MSYTSYEVVLIAEDGEYILSQWNSRESAENDLHKRSREYGEGQQLVLRQQLRSF